MIRRILLFLAVAVISSCGVANAQVEFKRELEQVSFVPKGQWITGVSVSFSQSSQDNYQFFIVEGIDRSKCAIIITEQPDEICKALSETFESGVTHLSAKGGYSNRDKSMIYFIINRYQIIRMKDIVHNIDPFAYITISEVADIFSSNNNNQ